ncbi:MAG: hypothetical protein KZQ64_10560 [gamma proteobacterium symbiont of Bathyaustriella thionipta]|nr:hypothetical protein [gamma proteobacterium symbiont of Bathyaustriella thionipta]MCU7951062.1 hypothetical protein [gamma proteobacterium symbiont of Bathyaustriella thionipta]MCU7953814.1 hypothetical protein [gamma proteobacterium symbiont of Bathyaustriella thionipta]MCU7957599.1 hypothetical protein [gamma proteobacterium symbiont of Bathyaustriella thionipta]MCU7966881.1 hypothetical protein [gamma proteobacterium symbiont of Bathyaustriella thionipta]
MKLSAIALGLFYSLVRTLDIGVPTFAMHSIRELCGQKDAWYLFQVLQKFFDFSSEIHVNSL